MRHSQQVQWNKQNECFKFIVTSFISKKGLYAKFQRGYLQAFEESLLKILRLFAWDKL